MPQLEGRVFSRQQQYDALPTEIKDEVSALVEYLTARQHDVFGLHHANLIKSVRSVRAKPLTEKITAWLLQKEEPVTAPEEETQPASSAEAEETKPAAEDETKPATEEETKPAAEAAAATEAAAPAAPTEDEAAKAKEAAAKAKEEAAAKAKAEQEAAAARLAHAKKLLEALVLRGFVTPYKESEKLPLTPVTTPETFAFGDRELFVPLAAAVAAEPVAVAASAAPSEASASAEKTPAANASTESVATTTETPASAPAPTLAPLPTTVWDLMDGAVFAGALKRKAGFLAPLTAGKDVYVVVNATRKTLTLFESDLARAPLLELGADGARVAFDKSHFQLGVKVWTEAITELLNATSKLEREALVHALLAIGLTYHEEPAPGIDKLETIYSLKDTDIDGKEVAFDAYKGKVLLIVNVSSQCGLTPTNYPELVALYDKYKPQGFEVLGFPCNQFLGQEPGTHDEIKAFVAQYNVSFPLFAKGDVNGVDTRPVFAYLKHKLPESYIQWNFTKFLVDRNGVPVKRFGPRELPLSFEGEIVKLLADEAKVEAAPATTEEAAPAAATEEVKEAVAAAAPAAAVVDTPADAATEPGAAEAAEPTPEVAPVEETKPVVPAEAEKPATSAVETPDAAVEEPKAEAAPAPAVVEAPKAEPVEPQPEQQSAAVVDETVVVTKTESPAAAPEPQTPAEEPTPAAAKAEPAVNSNQNVPVQGFTPGNEPGTLP